jgi:hypothetical protein
MIGTTFRDMLMLFLLLMMFLVVAMVQHIHPPSQHQEHVPPPGNVIVHTFWPKGPQDVDTWMTGPGEPSPVGWTNPNGVLLDLLRDDTGTGYDATPLNYEDVYSRGIVPGRYTVNVHCYSCVKLPVPVTVEISVKGTAPDAKAKVIATTKIVLKAQAQEVTALDFKLDALGNVVKGSMNTIYQPMVNKGSE